MLVRDLRGKTLFITGASRGIGLAIAVRAARDGANVVIAAKSVEENPRLPGTIHTAAAAVEAVGGHALPVLCDIRFEDEIDKAVAKAVERFGGIDVCVNNASAVALTGTLETTAKRYDLMHDINARGTYFVTQKCLPHLLKSDNAHVLNISPPLDFSPRWFAPHPAYSLAKYAMSVYAMGMAEAFRAQGVAFNTLWPRTAIATAAIRNVIGDEQMIRASRRPEIMADAAYLILTRDSRSFTGQHCMDDVVLAAHGRTDLRPYRVDPDAGELAPDFFVPDFMPPPAGVRT
jgi:citronellol/citronellal dehydrogenase